MIGPAKSSAASAQPSRAPPPPRALALTSRARRRSRRWPTRVEPDAIVVNAKDYTVDAAVPRAEAFAIKKGRFVAVGSTSDIRNLAAACTQPIDAQDMIVTPRSPTVRRT